MNKSTTSSSHTLHISRRKYVFIFVCWSVFIAVSLIWNVYLIQSNTLATAAAAARASITKDIVFRKWATSFGGVYVSPTTTTPPNPYLKVPERDVVTTSGKKLTLINPAYMLRDLQTRFGNEYGNLSHITSLKPINPINAADVWETKALHSFEQGNQELLEVQQIGEQPYLRLMRAFPVEQGCLKCHGDQGYKLGDIRGGISVSEPLQPYLQQAETFSIKLALSHGLVWLIGVVGQGFAYRRFSRLEAKRKQAENRLKLNERCACALLDLTLRATQLSEQELVQTALTQAEALTGSEIAYAHYINDDQESLTLGTWSAKTLQRCNAVYDSHYPISQAGIWADCFREKRPIIVNDYPSLATKNGLPQDHATLRRVMNVPVMEGNDVRMIIGVGNKAIPYDENDLRETELIASSLWSLVKRKRVELELQQYHLHLEELVQTRTEELLKAKDAAEAANIAKSTFIATMSHELRTPLNAILGFSELMGLDSATTAAQKETLDIINRSGAHLLNMINDVLDISKIEAGRFELDIQAVDLPKLLQDISDMIRVRITQNQLHFQLDIAPDIAPHIKTDSGKLRQVLINLLGNAVKFTQHGNIALRADSRALSPQTVQLHIEVSDSGIGIPADKQHDLFKPFVQLVQDNALSKGTGLGLAISKSLVELMGGQISVSSRLGEGSTFKIDLPVAIARADELIGETIWQPVKSLVPNQMSWRLLVVDDHPENRLLLTSALRKVGFQVREAINGQEAVDVFAQWQPHLIWMDMRMPVMDGYEASQRIRQMAGSEAVKIVAVTASVFKEQHNRIIQSGCDAVLHKPLQVQEIFATLTKMLGVKFVPQENVAADTPPVLQELTGATLAALPLTLRQTLHDAALNLDIEETTAIITQIRGIAPAIADSLQQWVEQYQFERIIQLIGKSGNANNP